MRVLRSINLRFASRPAFEVYVGEDLIELEALQNDKRVQVKQHYKDGSCVMHTWPTPDVLEIKTRTVEAT